MTEGYTRPAGEPEILGGPVPPVPPPTPPVPPPSDTSGSGGKKDAAKDEASNVAHKAGDNAKDVAGTAKDEAKNTAQEATRQAKDLLNQSKSELSDQVGSQQQRLAGGLRSFSDELSQMADGAQEPGVASDLARQVSRYAQQAGDWLEQRDPSGVLEDCQRYARRHPGTFMAIAAGLGVVAGRLTRSLKDSSSEDEGSDARYGTAASTGASYPGTTTAPTGYGTAASSTSTYTTPPAYDTGVENAPGEVSPGMPGTEPLDRPSGSRYDAPGGVR